MSNFISAANPPQLTKIADTIDSTRVQTITYTTGRISSVTDGTRNVIYTYSPAGDLATVQDVCGQITNCTYQNHLLTQIKDPLNQIVEGMGYQGIGNASQVITQTIQDGRKFDFSYLPSGTTVMTSTGVDGRRTVQRFVYGSNGALAGVSDASDALHLQSLLASGFDASFSPSSITDGRGNTTVYTYSYLNASNVWTTLAQPLTVPLPKDSRLLEQRWPDGVVTHYDYDATKAHQVVKMTVGYGTALKQETTYLYDSLGRVTSVTAARSGSRMRWGTMMSPITTTKARSVRRSAI